MPRVLVPTESDAQAADQSQRRRRLARGALLFLGVLAAVLSATVAYRTSVSSGDADTVFVSAPASRSQPHAEWSGAPMKEWFLQVGTFTDERDAAALARRLAGLQWPVSVVMPLRASDSLHKVIVTGIPDTVTANRIADSLGTVLKVRVAIIAPTGARSR